MTSARCGDAPIAFLTPTQLLILIDYVLLGSPADARHAAQVLDRTTCSMLRRHGQDPTCGTDGRGRSALESPPTLGSIAFVNLCSRAPDLRDALSRCATDALVAMLEVARSDFNGVFEAMLDLARLAASISVRAGASKELTQTIKAAALLDDLGKILVLAREAAGRMTRQLPRPGRIGRLDLTDRMLAVAGAGDTVRRLVRHSADGAHSALDGDERRAARIIAVSRSIRDQLRVPTDVQPTLPKTIAERLRLAAAADRDEDILLCAADEVAAIPAPSTRA